MTKNPKRNPVKDLIRKSKLVIGIIGTGTTGRGIALAGLISGNKIIVKSRSKETFKKIFEEISAILLKDRSSADVTSIIKNLSMTTDYNDLKNADIIIESVVEDEKIKREIFKILDKITNPKVILATNTSSLSVSLLSEGLSNPERVIGMHFFTPVHKMKLVELIRSRKTSQSTIKTSEEIIASLNKTSVIVDDVPGFIVNRLLFLMINEACHMLDEKSATKENIDSAMKLGANHSLGPFELCDLIGLDVCLKIITNLHDELKDDKFKPSKCMTLLVKQDKLGRKSGEGFYRYDK